ncbi:zinc knuckle (CCHC-type) family protein [Trifolium repens]|nr:zinc knuckle (CCHC-type) family protein [Trifolium repens]
MDSSPKNHSDSHTNNRDTNSTIDTLSPRPYKVQKTNSLHITQQTPSINIPTFMGPVPTIIHHEENPQKDSNYFPYSPSNLQNEEGYGQDSPQNQQNQQEFTQDPQRKSETNNQNSSTLTGASKDPFCMYKEEHVAEGISTCNNTLIGKILSSKTILKPVLHNTLQGIWGDPKGLAITEIEGGFFHISMDNEKDIQRALKGNPWMVRNCWFLVQLWDRQINPSNLDFLHAPAWIQIWGLPIHCKTAAMGRHLGSQLGKVEDAAIYDYPQKARIVKVKVCINIEEPIRPGMFIGNPKDGINWVDFRYENLPMFCFNCGLIGHNEDKCESSFLHTPEGSTNLRGPWLRSNIYGKRVHDNRDKRFHSNPLQSASGGQFSTIPQAMLDMLAKMKLEEESEGQPPEVNTTTSHTSSQHQQTPTTIKRKFQKTLQSTHQVSQITTGITSPRSANNTMVSLEERANRGQ